MDSLSKNFEQILRAMVLPSNDFVQAVKVVKSDWLIRTYEVTYYITGDLRTRDRLTIISETNSLFNMLSLNNGESLVVKFKNVKVVKM